MVTRSAGAAIVETITRFGVERVYGIPGYHILDIYDALGTTEVDHVMAKNEAEAVRSANGQARVTREPAVTIVSAGPGAINGMTGIAEANAASLPVVVIAGAEPRRDGGHCTDEPSAFPRMFTEIAKDLLYVDDPRDASASVAEAFRIAAQGRPGPVVVQVPIDTLKTRAEIPMADAPETYPPLEPDAKSVSAAAEALDAVERPVVVVGQGSLRADATDAVDSLAARLDAPVVVTTRGFSGYVALPRYAGIHGGNSSHIPAEAVLDEADAFVGVGVREAERRRFDNDFEGTAVYLLERIERYHLGEVATFGALVPSVERLAGACESRERDWWREPVETGWEQEAAVLEERLDREAEDLAFLPEGGDNPATLRDGDPIHPARVVLALNDLKDDDAIVTEDVGIHAVYAQKYVDLTEPNSFFISSDLGAMGHALPSAIGAKFAAPDRQVVGIVGDGSILMNLAEFVTAAERELDVTFLLFNNRQHNAIFKDQTDQYGRGGFTTLPGLDYAQFAENAGGLGVTIRNREELEEKMACAFDADAPALVDIWTIPNITFADYENPRVA